MSESDPEFDDPAFQAAVRRTMGGGIAPPSLRWKVASMLSEAGQQAGQAAAASDTARQTVTRSHASIGGSSRFKVAAAAAVMLVAVGVMVMQIRSEFVQPAITTSTPVSPITATAIELVHTHDQCAKLADHHIVAGDDLSSLGAKLSAEQKIPVFAASPGPDWQFKGAGLCPAGSSGRAAHLLFTRADTFVSIFSLPSPPSCGNDQNGEYHQTIECHPVAGVYHDGALYCVVGSRATGEMSPAEIEPILSKVSAVMAARKTGGIKSLVAKAAISH